MRPFRKTTKLKSSQCPKDRPRRQLTEASQPSLRFSPTAWAKLAFFRDHGPTEIGGFGITDADDLLYVEDFMTVKQEVTGASVCFDDDAVADFFDVQVDAGRKPEQFARVWLHTHPGFSAEPSATDEETFARVFGGCQWAVLFIVGIEDQTYARLRFNVGPGGEAEIPVVVDYSLSFTAADHKAWRAEYEANIIVAPGIGGLGCFVDENGTDLSDYLLSGDFAEELKAMDPEERRQVLVELTGQPEVWQDQEVVI